MTKLDREQPLYIKVNEKDNVAIIVNEDGLKSGTIFEDSLQLIDNIPQGHKVALIDIDKDMPIIRYGEIIGYSKNHIKKGSWVNENSLVLAEAYSLDELELATNVPEDMPFLEGYTFMGYRNPDGTVGTKNILGITTTVQCVEGVVNLAEKRIKEEILPKYKNVDGIMMLNHNYGCGVAINAKDAEIPIRTIRNMAYNPNFGGEMLVVGLGCEKLLPEMLFSDLPKENLVVLQECNGFDEMLAEILVRAEDKLKRLDKRRREECPVSDLVVGIQCGGSDAFSGVTANPALGYASDLLVRAGAKVMFSEVTEIRDAVHLLTPRVESVEKAKKLVEEMRWYDNYLDKGGVDRDANPTPGNKAGGLANVIDKALGSVAKSGSSKIVDVLSPGERVKRSGLTYAATPASDFVCGTLQFASGMTLQVFTTGRGTTYNLEVAPVIKVSTNNSLVQKWQDLIDVNAGKIATGQSTIEEVGWEIFNMIVEVASGRKKTFSDIHGIYNALCLFNPGPVT